MRAIATLGAGLVLVVGAIAAQAAPAIDIFGTNPDTGLTDFGRCEDAVIPRGLPMNISVFVKLEGLGGISTAEFFIKERGPLGEDRNNIFVPVASGGLGWTAAVFPNAQAAVVIGNPFTVSGSPPDTFKRYSLAFSVNGPLPSDGCQTGDADAPPGYVRIFDSSISKSTTGNAIPPDTYFVVSAGDPPGSPNFPCPLVTLCNAPVFTAVCVGTGQGLAAQSGQFIVNPTTRTCTVATQPKAWSEVKSLYR